jgi:hypothetical protein
MDCPGDNVIYTCSITANNTNSLDLVWYINLDGSEMTVGYEDNEDVSTSIKLARNVFVSLEEFDNATELIVSRFTMVPGVYVTLPQAVIQCGATGHVNSSIIQVNVARPRGITLHLARVLQV